MKSKIVAAESYCFCFFFRLNFRFPSLLTVLTNFGLMEVPLGGCLYHLAFTEVMQLQALFGSVRTMYLPYIGNSGPMTTSAFILVQHFLSQTRNQNRI